MLKNTTTEIVTKVEKVGDKTLTFSVLNGIKHGSFRIERLGKTETEGNFKNGVLSGRFISYYSDGQVMSIINYKSGMLTGSFVFFYKSGVKQLTGNYKDGQYEGDVITYDEFGDVIAVDQYNNGMLNGKSIKYYPKNISFENRPQVMEIAFYKNGLLHGNKISFSLSGKVTSVIPYYKGRPLRYGTMTI